MSDSDKVGSGLDECWQTYEENGVCLEINTQRRSEGEWALAIVNEDGVASHWIETFATAKAAMVAGLNAIEEEGVEAFTSIEGFEYLSEGFGTGEVH